MKRSTHFVLFSMIALAGLLQSHAVQADDWMFRRSYYSHAYGPGDAGREGPGSRSAYRPPFAGAHPHFAIRGGWRINNYSIQNGSTTDSLYLRENWFDMNY